MEPRPHSRTSAAFFVLGLPSVSPGFGEGATKPRPPKVGSEVNRIRARGPRATLAYHFMFVRVSASIMEECGQVSRDCRWLLSWGEVPATWKDRPALDVVHALQK